MFLGIKVMSEDQFCETCDMLEDDGRCLFLSYFLESRDELGEVTADLHVFNPQHFGCIHWEAKDADESV